MVSIIILSCFRMRQTSVCLNSIFENTAGDFEIVIVDMGASDEIKEWLLRLASEHSNVRLVLNTTNVGTSKGRNQGAAQAYGDYLVFLDNDACVSPGWLEPLVQKAGSCDKIAACGSKIISKKYGWVECCASRVKIERENEYLKRIGFQIDKIYFPDDFNVNSGEIVPWYPTTSLLVKKDIFLTVSGFDENIFICEEDKDFSLSLNQKGYEIHYIPESSVYHDHSYTPEDYRKIRRDIARLQKDQSYFENKWHCKVFYNKSRSAFLKEGFSDSYIDQLKSSNPLYTVLEL